MRLISAAAVILAVSVVAAPAHAQASVSIAAGATVPVGSTSDIVDLGYHATLGVTIKPPLAPLGLRLEGMYNSMARKSPRFGDDRTLAGIANVTLSGAVPMGYLIAGLGMYKVEPMDAELTAPAASTDIGFNIGAGLNFPLTGFSTFAEARLHVINNDQSTKYLPITFGIRF